MYCYVCKRNPLLTYGSDWSPEDFYQPKFDKGWEGWGVAFPSKPELIISVDPADGKDYSATVKAEKCKEGLKIVSITIDDKKETMKKDEIYTDENGKKFRFVPVEEELTIEDCIKRNRIGCCNSSPYDAAMAYPTEAVAEKVLLYGLLQSVAHKLNGGTDIKGGIVWQIYLRDGELIVFNSTYTKGFAMPLFRTESLAEQAISIFAKSKFNLKKLYQ